ncbi:MAG: hypothetical protein CME98_17950 [Hyphomonas sp.]|nr:hypothetical protein [Hyphomonas sp.]
MLLHQHLPTLEQELLLLEFLVVDLQEECYLHLQFHFLKKLVMDNDPHLLNHLLLQDRELYDRLLLLHLLLM